MKLFRFGVNVGRATSRAAWTAKARKLEDLGYSVLTVPDHLTDLLAPLPALVSAAEATTCATPCWWHARRRQSTF